MNNYYLCWFKWHNLPLATVSSQCLICKTVCKVWLIMRLRTTALIEWIERTIILLSCKKPLCTKKPMNLATTLRISKMENLLLYARVVSCPLIHIAYKWMKTQHHHIKTLRSVKEFSYWTQVPPCSLPLSKWLSSTCSYVSYYRTAIILSRTSFPIIANNKLMQNSVITIL